MALRRVGSLASLWLALGVDLEGLWLWWQACQQTVGSQGQYKLDFHALRPKAGTEVVAHLLLLANRPLSLEQEYSCSLPRLLPVSLQSEPEPLLSLQQQE